MDDRTLLALSVLGCAAIVGATVAAAFGGPIPHELSGLAVSVAGFIMGHAFGRAVSRSRPNGNGTVDARSTRQGGGTGEADRPR